MIQGGGIIVESSRLHASGAPQRCNPQHNEILFLDVQLCDLILLLLHCLSPAGTLQLFHDHLCRAEPELGKAMIKVIAGLHRAETELGKVL